MFASETATTTEPVRGCGLVVRVLALSSVLRVHPVTALWLQAWNLRPHVIELRLEFLNALLSLLRHLWPDAVMLPPRQQPLDLLDLSHDMFNGGGLEGGSALLVGAFLALASSQGAGRDATAASFQHLHLIQQVVLTFLQLLWRSYHPQCIIESGRYFPSGWPPRTSWMFIPFLLQGRIGRGQVQHSDSHAEVTEESRNGEDPDQCDLRL
mmetsp:Transcript_51665/g.122986  ORF Transcript_51665/g.122986 Transcript_51665/m.122986 type:complete len:210 (-) Transcript_51665:1224-1853(-)